MNSDIAFENFMHRARTRRRAILKESGLGVEDASQIIRRLTVQNTKLRQEITDLKNAVPVEAPRMVDVTKRELRNRIKFLEQQVQSLSEELIETRMDLTAVRMMKRKSA